MNDRYVVLRSLPLGAESFTPPADIFDATKPVLPPRNIEVFTASSSDVPKLQQDPSVAAIAPSLPMQLIKPVNIQAANATEELAWGVRAVRAHESQFDGDGIVVAVLDTGINIKHPAFAGVEFLQRDFTDDGVPEDLDGHGTHCAGTIFGRTVDNVRIGVAPGVKRALNGKVIGGKGGTSEVLVNAINWAVENGAHVISMSLGMDFPGYLQQLIGRGYPTTLATSLALEGYRQNVTLFERLATLLRARLQPTLIVAATGNESRRDLDPRFRIAASPPAVSEGVVSVAALGRQERGLQVANFSNSGAIVSGPGVDILSAGHAGGLVTMSGTSMATPHVAGIAALWAQKLKVSGLLNQVQLHASIVGSGRREPLLPGFDPIDVGAGLVMAPLNQA